MYVCQCACVCVYVCVCVCVCVKPNASRRRRRRRERCGRWARPAPPLAPSKRCEQHSNPRSRFFWTISSEMHDQYYFDGKRLQKANHF